MSDRYHIRIQSRCAYNGQYARDDWRAYRRFMVWPMTFHNAYEAQKFMDHCFTFRGLTGRKLSASVTRCGAKPTKTGYGNHGS